ncbi:uncharacterized protein DUF5103 [Algoriphagus boseongensis]|uniref:Uncharacterized protein DUF5103 n=1 Tax=Algoriphagus boseongensis TaxID=1442587 RepID=A0A4R6T5Y7_9BACT|nr:type IX secretion system plug protein domain-containing protein [Algoriphagus boseongensis]TDQ18538.1 uncharacterized protein DUF5103 [Algoriphagus boseongensis]
MIKSRWFLFFFLLLPSLGFTQVLEDKVYSEHIQSVRLFPAGFQADSPLDAPVVSLTDQRSLILLFDDLAYDPELYTAKLIHCNADWTKSSLRDNDFSINFNQFNVNEYEYSVNTRIPYIHYKFEVPRVTKSGNYILKVFRNRNEDEVILTKRFMVFEELFTVGAGIVPPTQTEDRRALQQINAVVNYSKVEVVDPSTQIKILIRQNQRWDNAKYLTKPTFLNQSAKTIRYEPFDGSSTFRAGNEFRFVDLRFIRATGVNVSSVTVEENIVLAESNLDISRPGGAYSQYLDLNGQYLIYTNDRPGGNPEVESEYIYTTFYLRADPARDIRMIGSLTGWGKNPEAQMKYDPKNNVYTTSILLKQGWYDFQYGIQTPEGIDTEPLEGSHFETENEYEVLVYFRNLGSRYDQLVGYVYLHPNRRRL